MEVFLAIVIGLAIGFLRAAAKDQERKTRQAQEELAYLQSINFDVDR